MEKNADARARWTSNRKLIDLNGNQSLGLEIHSQFIKGVIIMSSDGIWRCYQINILRGIEWYFNSKVHVLYAF